ncbi:MAG TPA: hypothetical protein VI248_22905 [Kineosporiaceae bacterium]
MTRRCARSGHEAVRPFGPRVGTQRAAREAQRLGVRTVREKKLTRTHGRADETSPQQLSFGGYPIDVRGLGQEIPPVQRERLPVPFECPVQEPLLLLSDGVVDEFVEPPRVDLRAIGPQA